MFYKKASIIIFACCFVSLVVKAQNQKIADSLAIILQENNLHDTSRLEILKHIAFNEVTDLEKAKQYAEELIQLSIKTGNNKNLGPGYFIKGTKERLLGNYKDAIASFFRSATIAKQNKSLRAEGNAYGGIADTYSAYKHHENAIEYYRRALSTLPPPKSRNDSNSYASVFLNTGDEYNKAEKPDSALWYFNQAKTIFDKCENTLGMAYCLGNMGMAYAKKNKNQLAEKSINEAIIILEQNGDPSAIGEYLISIADIYLTRKNGKAALTYVQNSLQLAQKHGNKQQISDGILKLSEIHQAMENDSLALYYYKKHIAFKDSIDTRYQDIADLRTNYEVSQARLELKLSNQQKRESKKLNTALAVILSLTFMIIGILIRNNRLKKRAFAKLHLQKLETEEQKQKTEKTLLELQVTQQQLIQSAKMASLGELTAGIAHEIQNPLNFVNNFSEVNIDLLGELKNNVANKFAEADQADVHAIINDLSHNCKKISDHGKRADSIVKGMLQHSRVSDNKKVPTDINSLADEHLRLSYHGVRSKNNMFNATFQTDYANYLKPIPIVPQDIGRVLINIFNNAFYAVSEKAKQGKGDYLPTVWVTTKSIVKEGKMIGVQLRIKDNGTGIPNQVLEKIYQPFFTTKPTGQGTGLGLSLSYDIITNEHKGVLKVDTKEGEFTEFTIELPVA